jgi:uncharacterized protein YbaR (Trm112 family)
MDKQLLAVLVCPVSGAPLVFDKEHLELRCSASRLAYPIRDGIPILLQDEARPLSEEEVEAIASS